MELRRFIWLPGEGAAKGASILGILGVALLGLAGAPNAPAFAKFMVLGDTLPRVVGILAAVAVAVHAALWLHAQGDYLSVRYSVIPVAVSHLVFGTVFVGIGSASLVSTDAAEFRLAHPGTVDWVYTLRCVVAGEGALFGVLSVSALMRSSARGTQDLQRARRLALRDLARIGNGNAVGDLTSLRAQLETIRMAGDIAADLSSSERELAAGWSRAAEGLQTRLKDLTVHTSLTWKQDDEALIRTLEKELA